MGSPSQFPSGYHGHFRSKSRQEFTIPYREKAKPPPPTKFLNRSSARSTDHLFSRHDNRNVHASTMGDLEMHFSHVSVSSLFFDYLPWKMVVIYH